MVMYCLSNLHETTMDTRSEEEFKICRAEMSPGQKYYVKFTSPQESRFYSKGKYNSPIILSKSVPRRKSTGMRSGINRSLNFDLGQRKNQPYSNSPMSNYSLKSNSYLSRSAKILKSLDIDINAIKSDCKKINKTLNFDLTPSPKRFPTSSQSMSNLSLESPGIIKTLRFDSPSSSSDMSPLNISIESTDENQNQTPSQRNRTAKKSLSYCSSDSSGRSSDFGVLSPGLRSELRDKIDDIVSMTPKFSSSKNDKNHRKIVDNMVASTPRNLIDDYSDDDDEHVDDEKQVGEKKNKKKEKEVKEKEEKEEEEERPETPKNTVIVVPESMSAIKKSHRKERVSGRLIKLGINTEKSLKMDIEDEMRSKTPDTIDEQPSTPNCSIASIKKSHKRDKSKRKSFNYHSDDELSETGSLFDYSEIEKLEDTGMSLGEEGNKTNLNNLVIPKIVVDPASPLPGKSGHESQPSKPQETIVNNPENNDNSSTPENKIDYIRRIMTSSIKKSHKKVKDSNKKTLFKPRILDEGLDDDNNVTAPKDDEKIDKDSGKQSRSGTPENMNSSRLLLEQFSSVKKSHRKDKHRAVGFSQRQINLSNDKIKGETLTTKTGTEVTPKIYVTEASEKTWQLENLGTSPLDENEARSSPNKRKSPSSKKFQGSTCDWRIDNESADEEFQIFTPIKKKKPLKTAVTSEDTGKSEENFLEVSMNIGRCETPRLCGNADDDSFKTPIKVVRSSLPRVNNTGDSIEDINGRSTPENQAPLYITALSSIKKSHKKTKWTKSCKKTSYIMKKLADSNNEEMEESTSCQQSVDGDNLINSLVRVKNNEINDQSSPRASTSFVGKSETNSPVKTPPNCLETKTYMRLMQTTSIKRSHKKVRDKKKHESIILEPNLSDDGSLFDETEKSIHLADLENSDCLPLDDDDDDDGSFAAGKVG